MNISHRSIWNSALGAWIAVSEITRARGKRGSAMRKSLPAALALAGLAMLPGTGYGQSWDWKGGDGSWSDTGNWSAGTQPTATSPTNVTTAVGTSKVTITGPAAASLLNVNHANEVMVDTGGTLAVGDLISVGQFGTGLSRLTIQGGGTVTAQRVYAGDGPNAGTITVTGAGSSLTVAPIGLASNQRFLVGADGTGELHIDAGANVTVNGTRALHLGLTRNGTLFIGNGAGAGTLTADSVIFGTTGSSVQFNHTGTTTFSAAISGNGFLTKTGAGTTILTGVNSYTGGTTVSGGTLQGDATSLQGNITNNAAVIFDQAATGSYTGAMSGIGSLTKTGAGKLVLTGVSNYNGATAVNAGTLSVNGTISNSAVTVNSGGTLGGSGTVGSLNVMSGGVLAPGNSIGTLTINGNATFAAGSIYRVEVDAAGNNDRTNVIGTANLNGSVNVQASAGTYAANTTYTILNATGGRTGTFAGVTSNLAFLTPTLGYDANNVFLSLARNSTSFNDSTIAITPNQIAVSTALQNANAGATGDMATVQTALTGLSAEQARAAYDSVSGNSLVGLRGAGSSFAAGFGNQMQARMGAMQSSSAGGSANAFSQRPVLLAANDHVSDLMAPATVSDSPQKFSLAGGAASSNLQSKNDPANGFWLRGNGGFQRTSSDNNGGASKVRNSGLSAGFDTEVREGLRAGVALSSGTSSLSTDGNASGKSRGSAVALYCSYASGPWNFSGSTSLALGRNHMDRTVTVGAINRVASSDFDSRTLSAYGEAAYSMAMTGGWTLQPLAGLSLSRSKADGFTETGAGALNLQVAGQTTTSTKSLLGAKAAFEAGSVRLEPRVIWAHEFGDLNTPMTAQFQGAANASPFQVSGVALKRDTLILGLGASGSMAKNIDLFADLQAEHNSRQNNLAVLVGLRARW